LQLSFFVAPLFRLQPQLDEAADGFERDASFAEAQASTSATRVGARRAPNKDAVAGRPRRIFLGARLAPTLVADVEAWASANDASRSEAIRRLVELGLKAKQRG